MMVLRALGILFIATLTSSLTSGMSGEMAAGLIVELGKTFHSGGAYLLVSSEQDATGGCSETARLLINDHMPTAVMKLEQAFLIPFPPERLSVYVMYSAGLKDMSALQEVHVLSLSNPNP
jgi:hypothetical protein